MSNEQKYIITVRFPSWKYVVDPLEDVKYEPNSPEHPPYGVRYLFLTSLIEAPDWPEDDERWFTWDETQVIEERFLGWYKANINKEFDGEILFIDPADYVVADGRVKL